MIIVVSPNNVFKIVNWKEELVEYFKTNQPLILNIPDGTSFDTAYAFIEKLDGVSIVESPENYSGQIFVF